jgi:hypothetical protein
MRPANAETPTRLDEIIRAGVLRVGLIEDYGRSLSLMLPARSMASMSTWR